MLRWLVGLGLLAGVPLQAEGTRDYEGEEFASDPIHSDLPLYSFEWADLWPRDYADSDTLAGCVSRIRFGDWLLQPNFADASADEPEWYRFGSHGVFHCITSIRTAEDRTELAGGQFDQGFFVKLGEVEREGTHTELWAIQKGTLPGSEYMLLAREPDDDIITVFDVLQQRCPPRSWRDLAESFDIFRTGYCAINSQEDLLAMAKSMLAFPRMGTLELQTGPDGETPDPA